jgi:hypothetical protein
MGLVRFLRARVDESAVLNDAGPSLSVRGDLSAELLRAALRLRASAASSATQTGSPELERLTSLARSLDAFEPASLTGRAEQLAFWLNVYNALAIHAVLAYRPAGSVRDVPGFFRKAAYSIGGRRYSAEAIEHGILRGNRPPLAGLPLPFAEGDPRAALALEPPDQRVHVALNCVARSCPLLRVYVAAGIEDELEQAAGEFVTRTTRIEHGRLVLSPIFSYYLDDFGGAEGLARWLGPYLPPELRAYADGGDAAARIGFDPYDWSLEPAAAVQAAR